LSRGPAESHNLSQLFAVGKPPEVPRELCFALVLNGGVSEADTGVEITLPARWKEVTDPGRNYLPANLFSARISRH